MLIVGLMDGDGNITNWQEYQEFQHGKRNLQLSIAAYGKDLVYLLVEQTGTIRFESNMAAFNEIILGNPREYATHLLGRLAEAVVVLHCNRDSDLNWRFYQRAAKMNARRRTASRFTAIGTGLLFTKNHYGKRYNPEDTQRDIIWIDTNKTDYPVAFMKGSSKYEGIEAGLQIKVSSRGDHYILNDLMTQRYEVPMVYFPINDDFDSLAEQLYRQKRIEVPNSDGATRQLIIGKDFINIKSIDPSAFDEIRNYYDICVALADGRLSPNDLVMIAFHSGDTNLKNAIAENTLNMKTPFVFERQGA